MKINPFNSVHNNPYRKQIEKQEKANDAQHKKDKLEISQVAKEMQESTKLEAARQEKVNELKQKIESGDYKVDPYAVAKKFYEYWSK